MIGEKYFLDCPKCGRVEGYVAEDDPESNEELDSDTLIIEEAFESDAGTVRRICCPQCGAWMKPDRAFPA